MNEPNDPGAPTEVLPEPFPMPAGTASPPAAPPVDELPAEASPAEEPSAQESPTDESPVVRHDPFASMRGAPWMDRRLSPSGRAAYLLRREPEAFPVIEGRDPNHADLDAIVKRTVDYIAPILKREQATDAAYDYLEEERRTGIVRRLARTVEADQPERGFIKVSGDSPDPRPAGGATSTEDRAPADVGPLIAQLGPEARDARVREQKWREPSGDREYLKSLEQFPGHEVRLPDGSRVPDPYSPTGYLMSPVEDLRRVASAGRAAGRTLQVGAATAPMPGGPSVIMLKKAFELGRGAIAQGGEFDYQRKAATGEKSGFVQLRQFRNISNFNVGLFMQQAGFPLEVTLGLACGYAWMNSSNYRPDAPYGLDPQTREFIEHGYAAGKSGVFD